MPLPYHELFTPLVALEYMETYSETLTAVGFYLGSCSCGFTACGGVSCTIEIEFGEMVWRDFENNSERLPHVGPFKFDFDRVMEEIRKIKRTNGDRHSFDVL